MPYQREYLDSLRHAPESERNQVVNDLYARYWDGGALTLAEEDFICGILVTLRTGPVGDPNAPYQFQIENLHGCRNYRFRSTYILYFSNVNGNGPAEDVFGEIPYHQRMDAASYLQGEYQSWKQTMEGGPTGDPLLDYSRVEYKHQLKVLARYCSATGIWGFYRDYLEKSATLHSKFIYFLVREYYEEIGAMSETVTVFGNPMLLDSFFYVHIMARHYAAEIKQYQVGKTYHFDENIDYKTIPRFIIDVLQKFQAVANVIHFNRSIYFKLRNKPYAIHFKPIQGQFHLRTFYPIDRPADLARLVAMQELIYDPDLSFFI
jgi:hypothetical protein